MKTTLSLPRTVADEISDIARRAHRSAAFVVRRALVAASKLETLAAAPAATEKGALKLALSDDDDPKTLVRIEELIRKLGGDDASAIATAWQATRAQFFSWIAREEEADRATQADDLDRDLAEASSELTPPDRLAALAIHEFVQVRIRLAGNPKTPTAALEKLATEREKMIRAHLVENPSLPASVRAQLD